MHNDPSDFVEVTCANRLQQRLLLSATEPPAAFKMSMSGLWRCRGGAYASMQPFSLNDLFGDTFTVGMEKQAGDSLLDFWNNMEQVAVCVPVRQHPLARASHEATDRPIKVFPVPRQQMISFSSELSL